MADQKDGKVKIDITKVIVDPNPRKDRGLKPMKGIDGAMYGLEFRIKLINHEKAKLQKLMKKAEKAVEGSKVKELEELTPQIEASAAELTRLEKDFEGRCAELGLVPNLPTTK